MSSWWFHLQTGTLAAETIAAALAATAADGPRPELQVHPGADLVQQGQNAKATNIHTGTCCHAPYHGVSGGSGRTDRLQIGQHWLP